LGFVMVRAAGKGWRMRAMITATGEVKEGEWKKREAVRLVI
jgi:hypothetical protein